MIDKINPVPWLSLDLVVPPSQLSDNHARSVVITTSPGVVPPISPDLVFNATIYKFVQ